MATQKDKLIGKLTRSGLIISPTKYANIYSSRELKDITRKFRIHTTDFNGNIIYHTTYISVPKHDKIIFARMKGLNIFGSKLTVKNHISAGIKLPDDIWQFTAKLFSNQKIVLAHLLRNIYTPDNFKTGKSSCILNMKAGHGKTYLSMALIAQLKQKTLIIVPTSILLAQWTTNIHSNMPDITIGSYYTKKKRDGDVIIMICNSALFNEFTFLPKTGKGKTTMDSISYFKQFGLVIFDEVHKYCSPKLRKIFVKAQAKHVLGISATTNNRLDKLDIISQHYLGNVVHADTIKKYDSGNVEFKVNVTTIKYKGPEEYTRALCSPSTGFMSHPLMVNQICTDPYRKILLCNELEKIYHNKANAFVFADRREYLEELAHMLRDRVQCQSLDEISQSLQYIIPPTRSASKIIKNIIEFIDPGCNITIFPDLKDPLIPELSVLLGGAGILDIENAKNRGQIIFSTYSFLDTGVSIERMTHLIVATPRRHGWEQIIGRITRITGDISITRQIILISDSKTALSKQMTFAKNKIKKIFNATSAEKTVDFYEL